MAGPSNGALKAEATSSDKFAQVRGFKVEITSSTGKDVDTAWESVSGGEMIIEVTRTTIGSNQWAGLDLRDTLRSGPLAGISAPQIPQKKVGLHLVGADGTGTADFEYAAVEAVFNRNQLLLFWLDGKNLNIDQFDMQALQKDGTLEARAPRIFLLLPGTAPAGAPIAIVGTAFDRNAIPYINSVPSVPLFNFSQRNIPLLGSISVGFTIVPPKSPSGAGDVMVEYNGQQSNRFPFTKS